VQIARQIASTLAAVHRKSIVHRDLKPENIMLVDDPDMPLGERAKLLDFGIAKLRSTTATTEEAVRRTDVGIVLGTPVYMSPEQFLEEELDGQSDVYSLGAMIYEMVARNPPFAGRKWGELALKHLHELPVPLSQIPVDVPEELDTLVLEMLAKDLHDRPVMAQVVDRLDELAEFLRTGRRSAVAQTEMFAKIDPAEFGLPPLPEAEPARPAVPSLVERMPPHLATPAHSTRTSVGKAQPEARNEAKTIGWVTLVLGLVTAAFLLGVYLVADRHAPIPAVHAHTDPMVPAAVMAPPVVTTRSTTTLPTTTPPAAPGLAPESAQAPPSQGKSPRRASGAAPRFARRR
jgi:serine/threonine-protein kinase